MNKKFAVLAAMAALLVACGGPSAEELEAKKATADSIANVLRMDSIKAAEAAAAAAAAAAAVDSTAGAMVDSAAAKVEGAVDAAKKAVGH